jgi:hypothetical protein
MAVRLPGVRKPVGVTVQVPSAIRMVPGPKESALHGIEEQGGTIVGEIDVAFILPDLIMDRSGVLREAARQLAERIVAPTQGGYVQRVGELRLPAGRAFSVDAIVPDAALPHLTVAVLGHPDVMLPLALVVTVASVRPDWAAAAELLDSMEFTGAPVGAAAEVIALPFVVR